MINSSRTTVVPGDDSGTAPTSKTIASRTDLAQNEPQPDQPVEAEPNEFDQLRAENERLKKRLGDQGNSVGELRKQLESLQEQMATQQVEPDEPPPDFYDDPNAAIKSAVESELGPLKETIYQERADKALSAIREAHSDYDDVIQSEGFRDWMESSRYRQVMAREAEANLDSSAAIELVNMYKADTNLTPEQAVARDRELRASATETGQGYAGSGARYSWTELRLLQMRDPKQYRAILPKVMAAQAEGRVDP